MSLAEMLIAVLAGFVLLLVAWSSTLRMADTSARLRRNAQLVEVHRLVTGVLDAELAGARPGVDWVEDPAGLAVRAFRGWGVVCRPFDQAVVVDWRGLRLPDPTKDSLELVLADGRSTVVDLTSAATADGWSMPLPSSETA